MGTFKMPFNISIFVDAKRLTKTENRSDKTLVHIQNKQKFNIEDETESAG